MAIQVIVNDLVVVNKAYVVSHSDTISQQTLENLGFLQNTNLVSQVLEVGHFTTGNATLSYVRVVPLNRAGLPDITNPAVNNGLGVTLIFPDDTTLNNCIMRAASFLPDIQFEMGVNLTGVTIPGGSVVGQAGFDTAGTKLPTLRLASAVTQNLSDWLGIALEDIAAGAAGAVLTNGSYQSDFRPISTLGMAVSDPLYLSTTPGLLTATPPASPPNFVTAVAFVESVSAVGAIRLAGPAGVQGSTGIQGITGLGGLGTTGIQGNTGTSGSGSTGLIGSTGVSGGGGLTAYGYAVGQSTTTIGADSAVVFDIGATPLPNAGFTSVPAPGGTTFVVATTGVYEFNFYVAGTHASAATVPLEFTLFVNGAAPAIPTAFEFRSNQNPGDTAVTSTCIQVVRGHGLISLTAADAVTLHNRTNTVTDTVSVISVPTGGEAGANRTLSLIRVA